MTNSAYMKIFSVIIVLVLVIGIAMYMLDRGDYKDVESEFDQNGKWLTQTSGGLTFQYPETLLARYISVVDWPPQARVVNGPFLCTEAGLETARAGETARRIVDDRTYCVTRVTEGAAGSIYTQYAYAFPRDGKTAILTFSLRFPQCVNYDEPQRNECEREREAFDIDAIADRIVKTMK